MAWGPLQLIPLGLLGFFNLKNVGKNPTGLEENLTGTLDLTQWYLNTNSDMNVVADSPSRNCATGENGYQQFNIQPMVVPNDQWWYVSEFTIQSATLLGAEVMGIAPAYRVTLAGAVRNFIVGDIVADVTGPNASVGCKASAPFWVPPGADIGCFLRRCTTAGTISIFGTIRYSRLYT